MVPTHVVRVNMFVSSISGLPNSEVTIAEMLKERGYKTAYIGKWHLGLHSSNSKDFLHHPMKQGFDQFYGLPLTNLKDFGNDGESVVLTRLPWFDQLLSSLTIGGLTLLIFTRRNGASNCCVTLLLS